MSQVVAEDDTSRRQVSHRVGERRRRREAERAKQQATEASGAAAPLTRREIRRQAAEESARREALATGELRIDATGEVVAASQELRSDQPGSDLPGSDRSESDPPRSGQRQDDVAGPTLSGSSGDEQLDAAQQADGAQRVTRRSMREKLRSEAPLPENPEVPAERTVSGRRRAVRTPSSAQGIRRLDASGTLTGIQPAVSLDQSWSSESLNSSHGEAGLRPEDLPLNLGVGDIGSDNAQVAQPAASTAPAEPETQQSVPPGSPTPIQQPVEDTAATAETTEEHDGPDTDPSGESVAAEQPTWPARPEWHALIGVDEPVTRRSLRRRTVSTGSEEKAEPAPNPAASLVKVLLLVLVGVIIGILVWLLASGTLTDDAADGPVLDMLLTTAARPGA